MVSAQPQREKLFTPEEYLALERVADFKSEYLAGRIYAMAGASRDHNRISINAAGAINAQSAGRPCEAFAIDMRVKVSETGLYTYPDVVVVCGEQRFEDEEQDTLLNPMVIIEVLSRSTEAYDRGDKFTHYRAVETLTDYILIAQDKYQVEHYTRQPDNQWLYSALSSPEDVLCIPSIGVEIRLSDLYARVKFVLGNEGEPLEKRNYNDEAI